VPAMEEVLGIVKNASIKINNAGFPCFNALKQRDGDTEYEDHLITA
jgi:hypothetical protein